MMGLFQALHFNAYARTEPVGANRIARAIELTERLGSESPASKPEDHEGVPTLRLAAPEFGNSEDFGLGYRFGRGFFALTITVLVGGSIGGASSMLSGTSSTSWRPPVSSSSMIAAIAASRISRIWPSGIGRSVRRSRGFVGSNRICAPRRPNMAVDVATCNHPRSGSQTSAGRAHADCNWQIGSAQDHCN